LSCRLCFSMRFPLSEITSFDFLMFQPLIFSRINLLRSSAEMSSIGKGTFADHLVEQLIPSDRWGKEFVTAPIPERTVGDVFRLVAKSNGTIINVPGMAPIHLNAGDRKEFELPSQQYTHITSNQPVTLAQFVKSQQDPREPADPSMMIIPPYEQFGSDYTFTTPEYSHPEYLNFPIQERVHDSSQEIGNWRSLVGRQPVPPDQLVRHPGNQSCWDVYYPGPRPPHRSTLGSPLHVRWLPVRSRLP